MELLFKKLDFWSPNYQRKSEIFPMNRRSICMYQCTFLPLLLFYRCSVGLMDHGYHGERTHLLGPRIFTVDIAEGSSLETQSRNPTTASLPRRTSARPRKIPCSLFQLLKGGCSYPTWASTIRILVGGPHINIFLKWSFCKLQYFKLLWIITEKFTHYWKPISFLWKLIELYYFFLFCLYICFDLFHWAFGLRSFLNAFAVGFFLKVLTYISH